MYNTVENQRGKEGIQQKEAKKEKCKKYSKYGFL
jgi:hypothetical protein